MIGPYKLLEQIGEGGMGVVYMAEQIQPVRRRVALKIIKPGMDTKQVIARFEAERQALALMDHPNIARVHRGGATDSGRPYFVMELVAGIPITEYCDRERLLDPRPARPLRPGLPGRAARPSEGDHPPRSEALECPDHASSMVSPVPKVIDFGIAKATGQQLTEKTLFTGLAQFIGTPLYMSPEQADVIGTGRRHAQRHLQPRCAALRAPDRHDAVRCRHVPRGRPSTRFAA